MEAEMIPPAAYKLVSVKSAHKGHKVHGVYLVFLIWAKACVCFADAWFKAFYPQSVHDKNGMA